METRENRTGPEPEHIRAAAQAAGERTPSSGAQSVGTSTATMAQAAHGTGTHGGSGSDGSGARMPQGFVAAFDAHHPPEPELIADCVHCGFCLPTCPTYLLWGEEMDSPRGRIALIKMASQGQIGMTPDFARHIDQCLGCMACVTACPSGVQYNKLIEATRGQIERRYPRSFADRLFRSLLFTLFPHPGRLRLLLPALWLYQKLGIARLLETPLARRYIPARLRAMAAVLPRVRLGALGARLPAVIPARNLQGGAAPRRRVGMLLGCVQRVFFDDVNAATARVLAAEGCEVVVPQGQGCCGALSIHAGREDEGLAYARRVIDAFERAGVDTVVVNVAGCGSTIKEYGYLLRDDPEYAERARAFAAKVRDVSELLAELEPLAPRSPLPLHVAYHDACHLRHGQGITKQPRAVLRTIPGVELLDIPEGEICCGSAGIYNLVEPGPAAELGERKARNILSTQPEALVAANPGCLLQIQSSLRQLGADIPAFHPVELLDAAIRGVVPERLAQRGVRVAARPVAAPV